MEVKAKIEEKKEDSNNSHHPIDNSSHLIDNNSHYVDNNGHLIDNDSHYIENSSMNRGSTYNDINENENNQLTLLYHILAIL